MGKAHGAAIEAIQNVFFEPNAKRPFGHSRKRWVGGVNTRGKEDTPGVRTRATKPERRELCRGRGWSGPSWKAMVFEKKRRCPLTGQNIVERHEKKCNCDEVPPPVARARCAVVFESDHTQL